MQLVNDIKPVTYLKSRAADVLKHINETHRPMIFTQNGEAKAVIQDPKSYEDMKNAISILKLLSFAEEDIKKLIEISSDNQVYQQANSIHTKNVDSKEYIKQIDDEDKETNHIYLAFIPLAIMIILFYIFAWK